MPNVKNGTEPGDRVNSSWVCDRANHLNRRGFFARMVGGVVAAVVGTKVVRAGPVQILAAPLSAPEAVGVFQTPYCAGSQTITGVGFQPEAVVFYPPLTETVTFNADGFTLNFREVASSSRVVNYIAVGELPRSF